LEITPIYYSLEGEYFSNLSEEKLEELNHILTSIKFTEPNFSKEDIKEEICENQPNLIRLSFKYNDGANKVFVEEQGKFKPLTAEEWESSNYKWPCVDRYYIEEDIPDEVISRLPQSNLLAQAEDDISDWNTYENHDFDIELKYPAEWKQFVERSNGKEIASQISHKDNPNMTVNGPLVIKIDNPQRNANWQIKTIETVELPDNKYVLLIFSDRDTVTSNGEVIYRAFAYYVKLPGNDKHAFYSEYNFNCNLKEEDLAQVKSYHQSIFATILLSLKIVE